MLSDVLQNFQVCCLFAIGVSFPSHCLQTELLLDVRLAQIIEGLKVCTLQPWMWINDVWLTFSTGHSWWFISLLPPF